MFRLSTKQSAHVPARPISNHWLLATALSLTLLGGTAGYLWGANAIMQQADERATELTRQWSPALSTFFSRYTLLPHALELLPRIQAIPDATTPEAANPLLKELAKRFEVDALYVIRPSGVTAASSNELFIGENYGFRPYFRNALNGQISTYVALGATSGKPGYYIAGPIRKKGHITGVLAIKVRTSTISELLDQLGKQEANTVDWALSDEYGVIFAASREECVKRRDSLRGFAGFDARRNGR